MNINNINYDKVERLIDPILKKMKKSDKCYKPLYHYSGNGYIPINTYLLADQNEEEYNREIKKQHLFYALFKTKAKASTAKKYVKEIDECFAKGPITTDDKLLLWRGMRTDFGMKIGEKIVLKNFISCTYDMDVATKFTKHKGYADPKYGEKECCLFAIHVDKGVRYLPLSPYSMYGGIEAEILLDRNLVMTYMSEEKIGGKKGKYSFLPYETTLRHMKVSKLNDKVADKKIMNMSEPVNQEIDEEIKAEAAASATSYTPPAGKRCKKGTRKAADGRCRKIGAPAPPKKTPTKAAPTKSVPVAAPQAPAPAPAPAQGSPTSYTPVPGKRCKKGTHKASDGRCRKIGVNKTKKAAAAAAPAAPAATQQKAPSPLKPAAPQAQAQAKKCKEGEEISEKSGKCIKKCPPGKVRNPATNRCVKQW